MVELQPRAPKFREGIDSENVGIPEKCFGSLGESIEHATSGKISRAEVEVAFNRGRLDEMIRSSPAVAGTEQATESVLIGVFFDYNDYDGDSLVYEGALGGCSGGANSYGISYVGSYWNDDFASAHGYAGCSWIIYENANYGGARYGKMYSASSFGLLDEEGSSIKFLV